MPAQGKALYGLKQGGRKWFERLEQAFSELGFSRIRSNTFVFVWAEDGVRVIVPVFVDDITIVSKDKAKIQELKLELGKHFKLRNHGATSFLLGVEITRNRAKRTLHLSQRQYILDLLNRFGFADSSPVLMPHDPGTRFSADQAPATADDEAFMHTVPYVSAVGALMYLAIATRPDIAYSVGILCCFMAKPGPARWKAVKHLFRYLRGTCGYWLTYAPDISSQELFSTCSDADHGGNPDNGRSVDPGDVGSRSHTWESRYLRVCELFHLCAWPHCHVARLFGTVYKPGAAGIRKLVAFPQPISRPLSGVCALYSGSTTVLFAST
jgi:hypothetical protein